jgi:hypothetical protein
MSTALDRDPNTPHWMSADELRAIGFQPGGPETDYGMRWGEQHDVRVSFAPYGDRTGGYLYAYQRSDDRYLLLATNVTPDRVDAAWHELTACTSSPDGYLALAALDDHEMPMPPRTARALLMHCVEREFDAYRTFADAGPDQALRFEAASAVVIQRTARVSAERLLIDGARAANSGDGPVVVRYRILEEKGWTGRVAGADLAAAAAGTKEILELAAQRQLTLQATSVTHGHAVVAAPRVPELAFAATRPPVVGAPTLGI